MEAPSWYLLGSTVTGTPSPATPWTNLFGFLLFLCIIVVVIWILYLLVQMSYAQIQQYEKQLYNVRYDEIF